MSADLGFAGGVDFSSDGMKPIEACVEKRIGERYGLRVATMAELQRGAIRMAPSSRIVSPLSIGFSRICSAIMANSSG